MRPSLREDIIQTSIALFNERGYGNVSLRDISGALGISVGNLNYYFAKKQDILQAIMGQTFLLTASENISTLTQLHDFISRLLDSLPEHSFYFRDPSLHSLNDSGEKNVNGLYRVFVQALETLQAKGLFLDALTPPRRESLVKILMLSHLSWFGSGPQFNAVQFKTKEEFLAAHWMLLAPYFTQAGWEEYHRTVETVKKVV